MEDSKSNRRLLADQVERTIKEMADLARYYKSQLDDDEKRQDIASLCTSFQNLSDAYDQIEELRKSLYNLKDWTSKKLIPEALDRMGLDKVQVPELARSYYPLDKYSASIKDGQKEDAFEWLRARGAGSLIIETVNAQTLAVYLKDVIVKEGADAPECMNFSTYQITGSSKYTPKEKK